MARLTTVITARFIGLALIGAAGFGACASGVEPDDDGASGSEPATRSTTTAADRPDAGADTTETSPTTERPTLERPPIEREKPFPTAPGTATLPGPPPTGPTIPLRDVDDQLLAAISDLAERVGTDVDEVELVRDEPVTWSDGSFGCPRPGMNYTQALVDGRLVVLRALGVDHEYHATRDGELFWCSPLHVRPPAGRDT